MPENDVPLPELFGSWGLDQGIHEILKKFVGRDAVVFVNIRFRPHNLLNGVTEWRAIYLFGSKRKKVMGRWLKREDSIAITELMEFFSDEKLEVFTETYERL